MEFDTWHCPQCGHVQIREEENACEVCGYEDDDN